MVKKKKKITLGGNARAYQELFAKPNHRLEKKKQIQFNENN
jgi:hypothetical protein